MTYVQEKLNPIVIFIQTHFIWILLIFFSFAQTHLVFFITSTDNSLVLANLEQHPFLIFLNVLPVYLLTIFLYFISNKGFLSMVLTSILFTFMAVASKIKVTMRQEPLLPTDLSLAKEAFTIVKTFPTSQLVAMGILFLICIILIFVTLYFDKKKLLTGKIQVIGLLTTTFLILGANRLWYTDTTLYDKFPVIENPYFQINQYNSKGLIYSFFHQSNIMKVQIPKGYAKEKFNTLESMPMTATIENPPHIIMIMSEAYSDLSTHSNLSFENYTDPMKIFNEMASSENAISGKIVVPNFGGGTSNTEFDVLTATPTNLLDSSTPSYNFVLKPTDSLPHRLQLLGYNTLAIHPGHEWFYNRQHVYPYLGFEDIYFLEDSFDLETQGIGGYINEPATTDKIIETLDTHIATTDTPLFSFTVTIQNHGPYESKYGPISQNFQTQIELTSLENNILNHYFQGISNADQELERLKLYAEESEEPIVIVYFGDHLPGFSNGTDFFELLDYPIDANGSLEEQLALYQTPFLIWQNDVSKETINIHESARLVDFPENHIISAHYLGALTTEVLGLKGLSPLYDYVNHQRNNLPVITNTIVVDAYGDYKTMPTPKEQTQIEKLQQWQYFKLFDEVLPQIK